MSQTNGASGGQPAWLGDQAPCVYCGQVIPRSSDRCEHCRTSLSLAVRKASREVVGPWYYLDPRNPSGRGVTFETLIKMMEKGRIRPDSIVRGPTTHQDWMYAAEAPRLAKYLGMCPHCFAEAKPEDTYCVRCQLNMNQRPADPRPGIPADLVKPPVHKAAYEIEKELSRAAAAAEEAPTGESLDTAPKPAPGPAVAPSAPAARSEAAAATAAAATAVADLAAADLAAAGGERPSRVAVPRRQRPRIWVVLILTWVTLIVLVGIGVLTDMGGMRGGLIRILRGTESGPTEPDGTASAADEKWRNAQLASADAAEQARDYDAAVNILRNVLARTMDPGWRDALEKSIERVRKKAQDEYKARVARLVEKVTLAKKKAEDREFGLALDIVRNIPPDDRAFLASLRGPAGEQIGISVEKLEAGLQERRDQYEQQLVREKAQQKKLEEQLVATLQQADRLVTTKRLTMALEAYKQIAGTFPADLVQKHVDIDKIIAGLETQIAAAPTPTPTPAPTPTPTPTPGPPDDAVAAVKALMDQAAALDKAEQFEPEVAKLEEIKAKYDQKYWPDGLEDKIKQVKAKIEALKFFGMESPKKTPKPPPKPP